MIKVEITEIEKKEEIKQGDLLEYPDGDVVLVTDPEGITEKSCKGVLIRTCDGDYEFGDYDDAWLKYKTWRGQPVKHFKDSFIIEQIDDGAAPKQGDVMISTRDIGTVVMFVSNTEDCKGCIRDQKLCKVSISYCFTGVGLRHEKGEYRVNWNRRSFKKLHGKAVISQD
jgi:hypothetical protein